MVLWGGERWAGRGGEACLRHFGRCLRHFGRNEPLRQRFEASRQSLSYINSPAYPGVPYLQQNAACRVRQFARVSPVRQYRALSALAMRPENRESPAAVSSAGPAEGVQLALAAAARRGVCYCICCPRGLHTRCALGLSIQSMIERKETIATMRGQVFEAKRGDEGARLEQALAAFDRAAGAHLAPSGFDPSTDNRAVHCPTCTECTHLH